MPTESEKFFQRICASRSVPCERVVVAAWKTPDFEIMLDDLRVAVEVKQLDPDDHDREIAAARDRGETTVTIPPRKRVRGMIAEAIPQFKKAQSEGRPCLLCVFDNTTVREIDTFTVIGAMYGTFGVALDFDGDSYRQGAQGFFRERKLTRNKCTRISAIAVLENRWNVDGEVTVYHNVFAAVPIPAQSLSRLADRQFIHDNPHDGRFVALEPREIFIDRHRRQSRAFRSPLPQTRSTVCRKYPRCTRTH